MNFASDLTGPRPPADPDFTLTDFHEHLRLEAFNRLRCPQIGPCSKVSVDVILRWFEIGVAACMVLDQIFMDLKLKIWDFGSLRLRFLLQRSFQSSHLRIKHGIMQIIGIKSRFPQTDSLFYCGTRNCDDCWNYGGMKFLMLYVDVTPVIEGCNHIAPWTRCIGLDVISLTGVPYLWYGGTRGYMHG